MTAANRSAANYLSCRENAELLMALQAWVDEQSKCNSDNAFCGAVAGQSDAH